MTAKRRRHVVRHAPKPKLLLDEGLPPRSRFTTLNQYCNVRHIKHDYRLSGAIDSDVYKLARLEGRVLVTFNIRDFKPLLSEVGMSVILI